MVKNVTGYALDKLYIGSFGSIGLITEVTFKLRPLPIEGIFLTAHFASISDGLAAMRTIAAKNLPLEMLRLFKSLTPGSACDLDLSATGTQAELLRITSDLRAAVPGSEFKDTDPERAVMSAADSSWSKGMRAYRRLEAAPLTKGATLRFGCTSSKLGAALQFIKHSSYWSVGMTDGIADLDPLTDSDAARIAAEFEKLGVNFSFENIVGVNIPNRWGTPRPEWAIMKQIKAALDPAGIMNPGRFVV